MKLHVLCEALLNNDRCKFVIFRRTIMRVMMHLFVLHVKHTIFIFEKYGIGEKIIKLISEIFEDQVKPIFLNFFLCGLFI